jgi:branched-chain amino acid transport system permease protein
MRQLIVRHKYIGFIIIGMIVLVLLPRFIPSYWTLMLTQVFIMALFATALNMEMGYAGMMPLGQAMFLGLGAYAFAIFLAKAGFSYALAIIAALVFCILINTVIGFICLRGKPLTFALLHLAFNILFTTAVGKWIPVTGGDAGITGIPRPAFFKEDIYFYFLVLGIVIICYVIIRIILNSPFGKMAQGLRENEERLRFLGIDTRRYQLVLFVIAGFFSGVAGILLTWLNHGAFPAYMSLIQSAQAMMMCLIGGTFAFFGPTLGSALVIIFSNVVSNYTIYWQGILGMIMVVTVLGFRGGMLRKGKSKVKISSQDKINKFPDMSEKTPTGGTIE